MRVPLSRIIIASSFSILLFITACTGVPEKSGSPEPSDTQEHDRVNETTGTSQEKNEAEHTAEEQVSANDSRSEEAPKGLSKEEIFRIARDTIPERFLFIVEDGTPVVIYHDLNNNGYRDALFLLVEKKPSLLKGIPDPRTRLLEEWYSNGRVPREALTSISRLYSDNAEPLNYFLSVFLQTENELISMYRIPLGAWKVLAGYESINIVENESMPLSISSSFETEEGLQENWVIFSRYNKFSTFTLKNTLNSYAELRDLDSNGKLDIVKWNQVFEEGTGYETFLSWYKWNGEEYVQQDSANVVRNLNKFLANAGQLLQAGLWEEAFIHMTGESAYKKYRGEDYSFSELFSLLFKRIPLSHEQEQMPPEEELPTGVKNFADSLEAAEGFEISEDEEARRRENAEGTGDAKGAAELIERDGSRKTFRLILFPEIMENPFRRYVESGDGPPYMVRLSVRIGATGGQNFVYSCVLQMDDNPFRHPQFFIVPKP